ncbi:integrase, catalytic region, zinc finger, CCHC-type containing protein [Tanacetum coccineum]
MLFTMPSWKLVNPPYKFKWTERTILVAEGIDNDIYSTVDACPNACEMWKAIEKLKQGESINVQDLETNLYWEFGKFISRIVKHLNRITQVLTSITTRMAKNEVNEIRSERLARTANPLALVAQQQPVYHPQNHPTHYTKNSSTRSQQAATRNRGKSIVNSPPPTYDQEPDMVAEDDALTSSNTSRANQDNTPRINRGTRYDIQRAVNDVRARENVGTQVVQQSGIQCYNCKEFGHVARECQKPKREKDAAYYKEKMLLCKQEEAGILLSTKQVEWRDDTNDEPEDQELEAHYLEYPEQPESVNDTYPDEQSDNNITTDSLDMSNNEEEADQDDDDNLAKERNLLASLIEKLKCEIDDSKNRNKSLESSNKTLVDKLKGEINDFKNKNKSLESSNNHFKEANTKLAKNNLLRP